MSMNPEQENFPQVSRLLVLKRYEQPPPGYFNDFSRQVIARIRAGEQLSQLSLFERLGWEAPWLQRAWAALENRPILAGAFGAGVCGLLLAGMLYSQSVEPPPVTASFTPGADASIPVVATVETSPTAPLYSQTPGFPTTQPGGATDVQEVRASVIRQFRQPQLWLPAPGGAEPVTYTRPAGGN